MGDSSENDTCITISSDNCSPVKPSSMDRREVEDGNCSSIMVSDTELEEGEISENEEKPESTKMNNTVKIDDDKLASKGEICSSSNSSSIKRKLSEDFKSNKKGKYKEIATDTGESNFSSTVEVNLKSVLCLLFSLVLLFLSIYSYVGKIDG